MYLIFNEMETKLLTRAERQADREAGKQASKQADTLNQRISSSHTRLNTTRITRYIGRFTSLVVSIVYLSWLLFPASFCFVCFTDSYTAHFFIVNYAHTHTLFTGSLTHNDIVTILLFPLCLYCFFRRYFCVGCNERIIYYFQEHSGHIKIHI